MVVEEAQDALIFRVRHAFIIPDARRGGRADECGGLENR